MNILANRIMSDAQFMTGASRRQATLAGVFLRDVAFEMIRVAALGKSAPITTAAAAVKSFVNTISESATKGHLTPQQYWQVYDDYSEVVRKYGLADAEQKAYSENKQFTGYAAKHLLDLLRKEQDLLFDSRNLLLEGILNETIRIYRVHGAGRDELVTLTLLTYLARIYSYIRYTQTTPDGKVKPEPVQLEILPIIEKIAALTSTSPIDIEKSTDILESLVISWREYYVRYMEPVAAPSSPAERGVELPPETKKKITEAITKELEKDTKGLGPS